ncbi:MAG: hypothetical protein QF473_36940, partial [Planctomycetota bacterium]|nr:hypothetical protein [Planctomycetota bacterium]
MKNDERPIWFGDRTRHSPDGNTVLDTAVFTLRDAGFIVEPPAQRTALAPPATWFHASRTSPFAFTAMLGFFRPTGWPGAAMRSDFFPSKEKKTCR